MPGTITAHSTGLLAFNRTSINNRQEPNIPKHSKAKLLFISTPYAYINCLNAFTRYFVPDRHHKCH